MKLVLYNIYFYPTASRTASNISSAVSSSNAKLAAVLKQAQKPNSMEGSPKLFSISPQSLTSSSRNIVFSSSVISKAEYCLVDKICKYSTCVNKLNANLEVLLMSWNDSIAFVQSSYTCLMQHVWEKIIHSRISSSTNASVTSMHK